MYLRETKRRNRDGSTVSYLQLAHSERHPVTGVPSAKVIHNFGRAEAVERYLTARHSRLLAGTEVRVQSRGACCYAAGNDSASGRAANRRVEVTFERDGGAL